MFSLCAINAESAIAAAVFLPKGSRSIISGITLIDLICSATINLCSSLQIIIGLLTLLIPLISKVFFVRESYQIQDQYLCIV